MPGLASPQTASPITLRDIQQAAEVLEGQVVVTPMARAHELSARLGTDLWLKIETQQATGSFKDRGACVKLNALSDAERQAGIIACSAGNHAQGVAYHAKRLGLPATIVMPEGTPFTKIARTESHGARVVLSGADLSASQQATEEIIAAQGQTFVHPYDDPLIIAGQGTVALEMLAAAPELDLIVAPIGGGGLNAGVAIAAKAINPRIRIIGVEAALYPSMSLCLERDLEVEAIPPLIGGGGTIAEGIAVKRPGRLTAPVVRDLVDEIVLVDEPTLETAVQVLAESQKLVAEGAGAAGLAALLADPARYRGHRIGVIVCGGNIDSRLLATVLMRGMMRDQRLVRLRSGIVDRPGTLARIAAIVGRTGGNIVEIYHQRMFYDVPAKQAELDMVIETRNGDHVNKIVAALNAEGFPTRILSGTQFSA